MTRSPPTVTPETALSEARELMDNNRLRYLPVVSQGRVVGVLRARAESASFDEFGLFSIDEGAVRGAMLASPECVPPSCPLRDVVHTMAHEDIGVVMIVDGVELKGMFTDADALRLLANVLSE
jgi:acetoin utilization protein AcuB